MSTAWDQLVKVNKKLDALIEIVGSIAESLQKLANSLMEVDGEINVEEDYTATGIIPSDGRYLDCKKAEACGSLCEKIPFMECHYEPKEPSDE